MSKITKAVIPCGGMGTRFLPITKAVPKEILPIIDTPVLAHIVNEIIDSGITDIMIVLGTAKNAIKSYFTPSRRLEDALAKSGKPELVELIKSTYSRANIVFARQEKPRGSGDAVLCAEKFTGKEPFCLAWGDDLIYNETSPVMGQLIAAHNKCGTSILGVQNWDGDDIVKYGVAKVGSGRDGLYKCLSIVEKPPLDKLPSRLASLGRYILTPDIYTEIRRTPLNRNEIQLTDALSAQCNTSGVNAFDFVGRRYDMGDKLGSCEAIVEYALRSKAFGADFEKYLKNLAQKL